MKKSAAGGDCKIPILWPTSIGNRVCNLQDLLPVWSIAIAVGQHFVDLTLLGSLDILHLLPLSPCMYEQHLCVSAFSQEGHDHAAFCKGQFRGMYSVFQWQEKNQYIFYINSLCKFNVSIFSNHLLFSQGYLNSNCRLIFYSCNLRCFINVHPYLWRSQQ